MQKEKEDNMYNSAQATIAVSAVKDTALDYIQNRLKSISWDKVEDLNNAFAPPYPKNRKQATEWIKEGNFRIDETPDEDDCWDYTEPFNWGKVAPDMKAKRVALEAIAKALQDAFDVVSVKTDEDVRLKVLQDFESATFH